MTLMIAVMASSALNRLACYHLSPIKRMIKIKPGERSGVDGILAAISLNSYACKNERGFSPS